MIRLVYHSADVGEQATTLTGEMLRFGYGPKCEIRLTGLPGVKQCHGGLVKEKNGYAVISIEGPIWVDGKGVKRAALHGGERIRVGAPHGPEIRVMGFGPEEEKTTLADPSMLAQLTAKPSAPPTAKPKKTPAVAKGPPSKPGSSAKAAPPPSPRAKSEVLIPAPSRAAPPKDAQGTLGRWLRRAQKEIQKARSKTLGQSSGDTMVIMAKALAGIRQMAEGRVKRGRRNLRLVVIGSLAVVAGLGGVIFYQHQRISQLVHQKAQIDAQIQNVLQAMAQETDQDKLDELDTRLEKLIHTASEKADQVRKANSEKATELSAPQDPLEAQLREILHAFNADTYVIPPLFKAELRAHVDELVHNTNLKYAYARKQRYWPVIEQALSKKQLPEALGYIAYTESAFEPQVVNTKSGAAGMWQLMEEVARNCGITVNARVDDRMDPARASSAAACYLSKLLVEFGEESFLLALASYNRGENGVRRALHKVAAEPGGFRKRDFWHLYRLKLLPEETREYVPKVLAAAVVLGHPKEYGLEEPSGP